LILRSSKAGEKMKPKAATPQCELFGAQLSELLNPKHPLYVLAERIDWPEFDAAIDALVAATPAERERDAERARAYVSNRYRREEVRRRLADEVAAVVASAGR